MRLEIALLPPPCLRRQSPQRLHCRVNVPEVLPPENLAQNLDQIRKRTHSQGDSHHRSRDREGAVLGVRDNRSLRGCEKMSGIQFRQDGLGMPSPYVVENKRSSVGARHASTVFRAQRAIFSQPLPVAAPVAAAPPGSLPCQAHHRRSGVESRFRSNRRRDGRRAES